MKKNAFLKIAKLKLDRQVLAHQSWQNETVVHSGSVSPCLLISSNVSNPPSIPTSPAIRHLTVLFSVVGFHENIRPLTKKL